MSKPFDFGRVFFPNGKNQIPENILFQPLGNHAANVRKLAWYWNPDDFVKGDREASRKRVADAAYLHDIGKPQKFGISVNIKANGKVEFSYSFRGHRFEASDPKQPWVEFLAKGHHDYSVRDICRDTYKLKTLSNDLEEDHPLKAEAEKYKQVLEGEPIAYAHELYILEMCDQIEAEIACRFFEDDEQAESRAFMDFTITQDEKQKNVFYVDPWIFGSDRQGFTLTLASWSMPFPEKLKTALEGNVGDSQSLTKQLQNAVKDWWVSQLQKLKSKIDRIVIQSLPKDELDEYDAQTIYETVGRFSANPMQEELAIKLDRKQNPNPALLLKAPTGTGKTESVLFPALANDYRLILVLPTRSLLEDQRERINDYLIRFSSLSQNKNRQISLVVDTGAQMDRWLYINGEVSKPKVRSRRHLYKGNIILTTLDKFLYRYFSFGDKQKSYIFPHRIHRENTLICFDEAHSYDEISFTNFQSLVQALYEAGRSLVLMTATMPKDLIERFDFLKDKEKDKENVIDFIEDDENREKLEKFQQQTLNRPYLNQRSFEWHNTIQCYQTTSEGQRDSTEFQNQVTKMILEQWKLRGEATRILAVVETVKDAAAIYQQLKSTLNCDTSSENRWLFLYHGRIADKLRPELYKQIKYRDEKEYPYILVTTSAIEVGCDLNAEVLISQICPPENLIQRAGRCNRRGNISDAKVILVGDRIPDFANSLDDSGWQRYEEMLQSLTDFDAQKVGSCISRSQHIDDYRVVELFSMLHDYVYSADLTCQPTHEKGLVITRSWTPSATLIYQNGEKEPSKITVPLDRLIQNEDNQYANTHVLESFYNQENSHRSERALTFGSAYLKDIIIRISPNNKGAEMFDDKNEYKYDPELGFVDLPGVFIRLKSKDFDEKLLCQHDRNDKQKVAIITYTKGLNTETVLETQENAASN
ncbi:CRISPR-associated helicase Cas3' [[Phormidium ambiguum] IAM M-71]|uniref:CRISPR-associated helicase Cas3 n=1 Tax=[Phormidium ambiguum] IAM M-71 TaxID=454136 RepID=A0A1U7II12_9CYAN|nr:CRISPR-associated helicase Cas3' [Phormidium ambiguum]OKH36806.1 CRISPR-associated helicase Cas3' [Phormidium ambiguum IAM M-71]